MSKMSAEDQKIYKEAEADVFDMIEYAKPTRQYGRDAVQGYMALALVRFKDPNRNKTFFPWLHGIVYSRLAEEAANVPHIEYKARHQASQTRMKFLNAAKENAEEGDGNFRPPAAHLWHNQVFDKDLFGVGFRKLGYLLQTRVVKIKDENGKWKEKQMIVYDDIMDQNLDFFQTGVSRDMLPGMFQGRACYTDEFFPRNVFDEKFGNNEFYFNVKLVPDGDSSSQPDGLQYNVPKGYVRVRHYWDLYKDLYYVLANGVPIRQDYILDYGHPDRPQKFLPITSIHNDIAFDVHRPLPQFTQAGRYFSLSQEVALNRSFWSKGDAKLVEGMIGIKNALGRAAVDNIKAASVHFALTNSVGVMDQIKSSDLYGIVPLKTDAQGFDVKSLTQNSNFLEQWKGMDEAFDNIMTFAMGRDWKRAATEMSNEKATTASIRQQVQRLRDQQNMKYNETGGIKRHYRLLLSLIQQYYIQPNEIELEGTDVPDAVPEEDVIRDADGRPIKYRKHKEIPFDKALVEVKRKGEWTLVAPDHPLAKGKKSAKSFKARKEYLLTEEEPEVWVESMSSFAEIKALDRALDLEKLQSIQPFLGLTFPDDQGHPQPLIPKAGLQYLLENYFKDWGDDPDKIFQKSDSSQPKLPEPPPPFGMPKPGSMHPPPPNPQMLQQSMAQPGQAAPPGANFAQQPNPAGAQIQGMQKPGIGT